MSTIYCIAIIPAGTRDSAEAAIAPYLLSTNAAGAYSFARPLSADGTGAPTHYGVCAPMRDTDSLAAALPQLAAVFPGAAYHTIPWKSFDFTRDWIAWLAGLGLRAIQPPAP